MAWCFVVEGAARAGVQAGDDKGVRVVHAPGSGDDAVVDVVAGAVSDAASDAGAEAVAAEPTVTVVTSDRELRRRVGEHGAEVVGPGWLLEQLG